MARWVAVHTHGGKLDGKSIISPAVLAELHTPQMTLGLPSEKKEISPASYAMGWMADTYRGHRRVHHGGAIDGFTANTCLFPDDGMGLVVLTNKDGTPLPELHHPPRGRPAAGPRADRLARRGPRQAEQGPRRRRRRPRRRRSPSGARAPGPPTRSRSTPATTSIPATARSTIELRDGKLVATYQRHRGHARPLALRGLQRPQGRQRPGAGRPQLEAPVPDQRQGLRRRGRRPAGAERQADRLHQAARPEALRPRVPQAVRGRVRAGRAARDRPAPGPRPDLQADKAPGRWSWSPDRNDEFNLKQAHRRERPLRHRPRGKVTEMAVSTDDGVFTAKRKP